MSRAERAKGFTLLEVLVALTVASVALAAMMQLIGTYVSGSAHLGQRLYAHWAASNVLIEGQLERPWPDVGSDSGSTSLGGREWSWRRDVSKTPYEAMRKVEVKVFEDASDGEPIARVIGYVGEQVQW